MDITNAQITDIVKNIWHIMFWSPAEPVEIAPDAHEFSMTGSINIYGAWNGTVLVRCSKDIISVLSSQALEMDIDNLTSEEMEDTMREVTNLIGGSIKPLLPSPSELSIADVSSSQRQFNEESLCNRVDMLVDNGLLRIELFLQ